jgi:predicted HD phosphohydrolase
MDKFTHEELLEQRQKIIDILRSTKREGIENLIKFLDKSKYFFCWGSFNHHKYVGGLAEHSLEVYNAAILNNKNCNEDSIIIAALMHDLCKTNYAYPKEVSAYFSQGHGSKSIKILEDYIGFSLTDEERRAIRFHMGSKCYLPTESDRQEYEKARTEELWELIHSGDCISCGKYPAFLHSTVRTVIKAFKL